MILLFVTIEFTTLSMKKDARTRYRLAKITLAQVIGGEIKRISSLLLSSEVIRFPVKSDSPSVATDVKMKLQTSRICDLTSSSTWLLSSSTMGLAYIESILTVNAQGTRLNAEVESQGRPCKTRFIFK
ncbi:hypothetical protein PsorP6_012189 [Peronosclerospora sorghi]|uniref:Uncharacterized protein n=1 Tax=Peronosclerospora sorghi TaxID=230839 RepID=A0ACC0WHC2_9STRA|nr:hypothetical protein PsorP6_012189 [Peronosclerospora sorghi]